MLQAANNNLINPLVLKANNRECQNLPLRNYKTLYKLSR